MKNCKMFHEVQTARRLKEIIQPPSNPTPPDKTLPHLWNKHFLKDTYRNMQIFAFKVLQECSTLVSRNGGRKMLCLTPNRNMFAGKFV